MDQTFWTYFFVVLTFGVYIGIAIWSRRVLGAAVLLVLAVVLAGCVAPAGTSTEQHSGDDDVIDLARLFLSIHLKTGQWLS